MRNLLRTVLALFFLNVFPILKAVNPVFPGWYADPEATIFDNQYWIYPTSSIGYEKQVYMDAFSSPDLVNWTKHSHVIDTAQVKWANRCMWAPAIIKKDANYFIFFSANDIQNDTWGGGIGVGISDKPEGPFRDYLKKPLLDKFYNGAQPIDQFVFQDVDKQYYMIYGGWKHCNIAKLKDDFTGFIPLNDSTTFKEITPSGYVEGSIMFRRNNKCYFMWSEGSWTASDYRVAYAIADSPYGPFTRIGTILQQDATVAKGAGHHSVINIPGTDDWYIVYHRRPLSETDGNSRETCIDKMIFDSNGRIKPVVMTVKGVSQRFLNNVATLYTNCAYGADSIKLGKGNFTKSDLLFMGFNDKTLSSIKIQKGYKAALFAGDNFTGDSVQLFNNNDCLGSRSFDKKMTSLKISRQGESNLAGTYYLQNKASGFYLGVEGNSQKENSKMVQNHGSFMQQFELENIRDNVYALKSTSSQKRLGIVRGSYTPGVEAELVKADSTMHDQQFVFQSVGEGFYKIFNNSDLILDVDDLESGSSIHQSVDSGQITGIWKLLKQENVSFSNCEDCAGVAAGNAYYDESGNCVGGTTGAEPSAVVHAKAYTSTNFTSAGIGLKVGEYTESNLQKRAFNVSDISSVSIKEGYAVELYNADNFKGDEIVLNNSDSSLIDSDFDNQAKSLIVRREGVLDFSGIYYLKNLATGLYMRVSKDSQVSGTSIVQDKFSGNSSQQFQLTYLGKGYYNLLAMNSNMVLSIAKSSLSPNIDIIQSEKGYADITNVGGYISDQYASSPAKENVKNLIDNSNGSKFLTGQNKTWVQFRVLGSSIVTNYSLTSGNDSPERDPLNWVLSGSDNTLNWDTLDTRTGEDFATRLLKKSYTFNNSTAYKYYRLDMINNSGSNLQLTELELFGTPGGDGSYDTQKFVIQSAQGDTCFRIYNKNSDLMMEAHVSGIAGSLVRQTVDVGQKTGLWMLMPKTLFDDVKSAELEPEISLYPNPVTSILHISGFQAGSVGDIYNSVGVKVKSLKNATVDVSKLEPGFYTLHLQSNNRIQNKKFIIK